MDCRGCLGDGLLSLRAEGSAEAVVVAGELFGVANPFGGEFVQCQPYPAAGAPGTGLAIAGAGSAAVCARDGSGGKVLVAIASFLVSEQWEDFCTGARAGAGRRERESALCAEVRNGTSARSVL